jgi:probable F420-dependent oxidoreductase
MKVDGGFGIAPGSDLAAVVQQAQQLEGAGYDGLFTAETSHDPFFPLLLAAEHTTKVELGTGIAVAFARNPMTLANIGYDLQAYSHGRFILGLGSQIKPHITKRFSMPWSQPAVRMRELILAMRAIWATWNDRVPLEFRGEFYSHTLMTPFFDPGPNPYGVPKIFLAAVGERMTEVTGEVADGMLVHAFTTQRYLNEVTLPALERGFAKGGRDRSRFELSIPAFIVSGANDEAVEQADTAVRKQIAFYGSTPAYRPVLDLHGWGDLQDELNRMSKQGQWDEMGRHIPDEVRDAFAVVAEPDDVPAAIADRYRGVIDRISFYMPYRTDPDQVQATVAALHAA